MTHKLSNSNSSSDMIKLNGTTLCNKTGTIISKAKLLHKQNTIQTTKRRVDEIKQNVTKKCGKTDVKILNFLLKITTSVKDSFLT